MGEIWVTWFLGRRLAFESSASTRQLQHNHKAARLPTGHGTKQNRCGEVGGGAEGVEQRQSRHPMISQILAIDVMREASLRSCSTNSVVFASGL